MRLSGQLRNEFDLAIPSDFITGDNKHLWGQSDRSHKCFFKPMA
ncbi:hypothetical protein C1A50_3161 [Paenibacillus polymyxa]|nr:hypothetical protein C1A50_3161 [Paenibacillus polymyxa]